MVANKVYHTSITTSSAIVLFVSKSFFSRYLFNEDGKGFMELFKGEKLDKMLIKFIPLCFPNIHNLITSLKHCLDNPSSFDILKLKTLSGDDYI